jgi:hypothetical protein
MLSNFTPMTARGPTWAPTHPPRRDNAPVTPVKLLAGLGAALVVVGAGVAGWQVAGAPADGAGTVPPPCPPALTADRLAAGRGGVPDRIVPVPLPQPRGPVAVRICRYGSSSSGTPLQRSVALDPPRTARVAGVLNTPPAGVVAGAVRPADCPDGGPVTLLAFRYTQGPPLVVEVDGGGCSLVSTSARVERGRADVVGLLDQQERA